MTVYRFSKITKEYLGPVEAFYSPLEDKYILKEDETETAPQEGSEGYVNVWNGSAWELKIDNRKKVYYSKIDGSTYQITKIGEAPLNEYTEMARPSELHSWDSIRNEWAIDPNKQAQKDYDEYYRARSKELLDSDWTQLKDARITAENQAEWAKYRDELCLLRKTVTPETVKGMKWPIKPSVKYKPEFKKENEQ